MSVVLGWLSPILDVLTVMAELFRYVMCGSKPLLV